MIILRSVRVNRKVKEQSNFVTMPKNEVTNLNEMYKRIEDLCKEKGVNMTQMCRDTNIPRGNLTDLKMNRTVELSTKTLGKIAVYFDVSMEYLLGHEEIKKPTDQKADGLRNTNYEKLSPENRGVIDALIEKLLKSQSGE